MQQKPSAADIRQSFLDYFTEQNHKLVPSASLVPAGDATLLFTNAGMVQFKDVFLGTDKRDYTRATNSQKVMRVAGKHNDLEDVGTDDSHHTFFEMLGNWSFGDYYKKEAITWAWQLLTEVWGLQKSSLYATCFKDDIGDIPSDDEAAENWKNQPGMDPSHILFFGRKDNFWEMADTGPCGPCSEIHIDLGQDYCDLQTVEGHECSVNGECKRFLELWNLVFIQYNRIDADHLKPLPSTHVDTGMGFERIVSVLQKVDSNYKTDLFSSALEAIRNLTGESETQMFSNFTPYRVIADHVRAAAFLISDGVVPGNTGRNYICRMIIRRAARFGTKIGLFDPFLAQIAEAFIAVYGEFFPEMEKNRLVIMDSLTREEKRFARTIESGTSILEGYIKDLKEQHISLLPGQKAFELYATYGLPIEITRDIARESSTDVDEEGFYSAMEEHRLASGGGKQMGEMSGDDVEVFTQLSKKLIDEGNLGVNGVNYNPYELIQTKGKLLALINDGLPVDQSITGDKVAVVIPETGFYLESGGQISDTGKIFDSKNSWEIEVTGMYKPAPGMIVHLGEVIHGTPMVGDEIIAQVDNDRRMNIMRNHTATHILHEVLHKVIGQHAKQAGSLVAPEKLRFDFNHNEAITEDQLEEIERQVNEMILADKPVNARNMKRDQALKEGAIALFGEKYGDDVRTISISNNDLGGDAPTKFSFELCGGTHLNRTGNIGTFLILNEGSVSAGIRRIEAVTGRAADAIIRKRMNGIRNISKYLSSSPDEVVEKIKSLIEEINSDRKKISDLKLQLDIFKFDSLLIDLPEVKGIQVLKAIFTDTEVDTLRLLCDRFRDKMKSGIAVMGTIINGRPMLMAAITEDVIERGIKAGVLVKHLAEILGGSGGGKPSLAQAGGKDPEKLVSALEQVETIIDSLIA